MGQESFALLTIFEHIVGNAIWCLPFIECKGCAVDKRYGHGSQRNERPENHCVVFGL
jgi:hypothetical protein